MGRKRFLVLCIAAVVAQGADADDVLVFAAASLKEALDAQVAAFRQGVSDKVVVSYGASSALAKQIEAGAPADMFIAADIDWMDCRGEEGAAWRRHARRSAAQRARPDCARVDTSTLRIEPGFDLAKALGTEKLAMANPDSVPAGRYGRSALESLGVWSGVEKRVARAENVRAALALVARGEAPYGIVYATDARADRRRADRRCVSAVHASAHRLSRGDPRGEPVERIARLLDYLRSSPARPCGKSTDSGRALWTHVTLTPGRTGNPRLSLRVASFSVAVQPADRHSRRARACPLSFPGKTLVDAIVHLPLVLPPVVVGFALLALLGKHGPVGSVLDDVAASSSRFAGPARQSRRRSWDFH